MNRDEALTTFMAGIDVFNNCGTVRRKLMGQQLTAELFAELNGEERGLEDLLERSPNCDFSVFAEANGLKQEILAKISEAEVTVSKDIHAALECYMDSLVTMCSSYDAYMEENATIRASLIDKLAHVGEEAKASFLKTKFDFKCFQYSHITELISLMTDICKFLDSDTCNLKRLVQLSTTQGGDMTDDDKEFLETLKKVCHDNLKKKGWESIDVMRGDSITGATAEALGYTTDNLLAFLKDLSKTELKFYKTIRQFREALVHDTTPTDQLAVKNTLFWYTVDSVMYFVEDVHRLRNQVCEQIALMAKSVGLLEDPKKEDDPSKKEDNANPTEKESLEGEHNDDGGEA